MKTKCPVSNKNKGNVAVPIFSEGAVNALVLTFIMLVVAMGHVVNLFPTDNVFHVLFSSQRCIYLMQKLNDSLFKPKQMFICVVALVAHIDFRQE